MARCFARRRTQSGSPGRWRASSATRPCGAVWAARRAGWWWRNSHGMRRWRGSRRSSMRSEAAVGGVDGRVDVQAVVLNWRAPEATLRCVESLRGSLGLSVDVLVVDNGSGDDSAERLRGRLGAARVLAMSENTGYAGGMNAG